MCWNFFSFGHGKGEVDGASAFLKREIHKEQTKPQSMKLQDAHDIVTFGRQQAGMYKTT
jgi:hypothetical protein